MNKLTIDCELLSPSFMAGADGLDPELRPPGIKAALRFWWRAFNGHLPVEDRLAGPGEVRQVGLLNRERAIFGGDGQRSSFDLSVTGLRAIEGDYPLVPHRGMRRAAFMPGTTFALVFRFPEAYSVKVEQGGQKVEIFNQRQLSALAQLACLLGGLGKRVRRGMGSVHPVAWRQQNGDTWAGSELPGAISLAHVEHLVAQLTPQYSLHQGKIVRKGQSQGHPSVRLIHLGQPSEVDELLYRISLATHETKAEVPAPVYEASLGHAFRGRFASPIFVSLARAAGGACPIITTLSTLPERQANKVDLGLQERFRNRIL